MNNYPDSKPNVKCSSDERNTFSSSISSDDNANECSQHVINLKESKTHVFYVIKSEDESSENISSLLRIKISKRKPQYRKLTTEKTFLRCDNDREMSDNSQLNVRKAKSSLASIRKRTDHPSFVVLPEVDSTKRGNATIKKNIDRNQSTSDNSNETYVIRSRKENTLLKNNSNMPVYIGAFLTKNNHKTVNSTYLRGFVSKPLVERNAEDYCDCKNDAVKCNDKINRSSDTTDPNKIKDEPKASARSTLPFKSKNQNSDKLFNIKYVESAEADTSQRLRAGQDRESRYKSCHLCPNMKRIFPPTSPKHSSTVQSNYSDATPDRNGYVTINYKLVRQCLIYGSPYDKCEVLDAIRLRIKSPDSNVAMNTMHEIVKFDLFSVQCQCRSKPLLEELFWPINVATPSSLQTSIARFLNALVSNKIGRDYFNNRSIIHLLTWGDIGRDNIDTTMGDNLMGIMMKLSFNRYQCSDMIQNGLLHWLLSHMEEVEYSCSNYHLQCMTKLLRNLLRSDEMNDLSPADIQKLILILGRYLGTHNDAAKGYICESLLTLCQKSETVSSAKELNFRKIIEEHLKKAVHKKHKEHLLAIYQLLNSSKTSKSFSNGKFDYRYEQEAYLDNDIESVDEDIDYYPDENLLREKFSGNEQEPRHKKNFNKFTPVVSIEPLKDGKLISRVFVEPLNCFLPTIEKNRIFPLGKSLFVDKMCSHLGETQPKKRQPYIPPNSRISGLPRQLRKQDSKGIHTFVGEDSKSVILQPKPLITRISTISHDISAPRWDNLHHKVKNASEILPRNVSLDPNKEKRRKCSAVDAELIEENESNDDSKQEKIIQEISYYNEQEQGKSENADQELPISARRERATASPASQVVTRRNLQDRHQALVDAFEKNRTLAETGSLPELTVLRKQTDEKTTDLNDAIGHPKETSKHSVEIHERTKHQELSTNNEVFDLRVDYQEHSRRKETNKSVDEDFDNSMKHPDTEKILSVRNRHLKSRSEENLRSNKNLNLRPTTTASSVLEPNKDLHTNTDHVLLNANLDEATKFGEFSTKQSLKSKETVVRGVKNDRVTYSSKEKISKMTRHLSDFSIKRSADTTDRKKPTEKTSFENISNKFVSETRVSQNVPFTEEQMFNDALTKQKELAQNPTSMNNEVTATPKTSQQPLQPSEINNDIIDSIINYQDLGLENKTNTKGDVHCVESDKQEITNRKHLARSLEGLNNSIKHQEILNVRSHLILNARSEENIRSNKNQNLRPTATVLEPNKDLNTKTDHLLLNARSDERLRQNSNLMLPQGSKEKQNEIVETNQQLHARSDVVSGRLLKKNLKSKETGVRSVKSDCGTYKWIEKVSEMTRHLSASSIGRSTDARDRAKPKEKTSKFENISNKFGSETERLQNFSFREAQMLNDALTKRSERKATSTNNEVTATAKTSQQPLEPSETLQTKILLLASVDVMSEAKTNEQLTDSSTLKNTPKAKFQTNDETLHKPVLESETMDCHVKNNNRHLNARSIEIGEQITRKKDGSRSAIEVLAPDVISEYSSSSSVKKSKDCVDCEGSGYVLRARASQPCENCKPSLSKYPNFVQALNNEVSTWENDQQRIVEQTSAKDIKVMWTSKSNEISNLNGNEEKSNQDDGKVLKTGGQMVYKGTRNVENTSTTPSRKQSSQNKTNIQVKKSLSTTNSMKKSHSKSVSNLATDELVNPKKSINKYKSDDHLSSTYKKQSVDAIKSEEKPPMQISTEKPKVQALRTNTKKKVVGAVKSEYILLARSVENVKDDAIAQSRSYIPKSKTDSVPGMRSDTKQSNKEVFEEITITKVASGQDIRKPLDKSIKSFETSVKLANDEKAISKNEMQASFDSTAGSCHKETLLIKSSDQNVGNDSSSPEHKETLTTEISEKVDCEKIVNVKCQSDLNDNAAMSKLNQQTASTSDWKQEHTQEEIRSNERISSKSLGSMDPLHQEQSHKPSERDSMDVTKTAVSQLPALTKKDNLLLARSLEIVKDSIKPILITKQRSEGYSGVPDDEMAETFKFKTSQLSYNQAIKKSENSLDETVIGATVTSNQLSSHLEESSKNRSSSNVINDENLCFNVEELPSETLDPTIWTASISESDSKSKMIKDQPQNATMGVAHLVHRTQTMSSKTSEKWIDKKVARSKSDITLLEKAEEQTIENECSDHFSNIRLKKLEDQKLNSRPTTSSPADSGHGEIEIEKSYQRSSVSSSDKFLDEKIQVCTADVRESKQHTVDRANSELLICSVANHLRFARSLEILTDKGTIADKQNYQNRQQAIVERKSKKESGSINTTTDKATIGLTIQPTTGNSSLNAIEKTTERTHSSKEQEIVGLKDNGNLSVVTQLNSPVLVKSHSKTLIKSIKSENPQKDHCLSTEDVVDALKSSKNVSLDFSKKVTSGEIKSSKSDIRLTKKLKGSLKTSKGQVEISGLKNSRSMSAESENRSKKESPIKIHRRNSVPRISRSGEDPQRDKNNQRFTSEKLMAKEKTNANIPELIYQNSLQIKEQSKDDIRETDHPLIPHSLDEDVVGRPSSDQHTAVVSLCKLKDSDETSQFEANEMVANSFIEKTIVKDKSSQPLQHSSTVTINVDNNQQSSNHSIVGTFDSTNCDKYETNSDQHVPVSSEKKLQLGVDNVQSDQYLSRKFTKRLQNEPTSPKTNNEKNKADFSEILMDVNEVINTGQYGLSMKRQLPQEKLTVIVPEKPHASTEIKDDRLLPARSLEVVKYGSNSRPTNWQHYSSTSVGKSMGEKSNLLLARSLVPSISEKESRKSEREKDSFFSVPLCDETVVVKKDDAILVDEGISRKSTEQAASKIFLFPRSVENVLSSSRRKSDEDVKTEQLLSNKLVEMIKEESVGSHGSKKYSPDQSMRKGDGEKGDSKISVDEVMLEERIFSEDDGACGKRTNQQFTDKSVAYANVKRETKEKRKLRANNASILRKLLNDDDVINMISEKVKAKLLTAPQNCGPNCKSPCGGSVL